MDNGYTELWSLRMENKQGEPKNYPSLLCEKVSNLQGKEEELKQNPEACQIKDTEISNWTGQST